MVTTDAERLALALAMVDASARQVCPDEWADAFDEYADLARQLGALPGTTRSSVDDEDSAGVLDGGVVLGIGLALLGQVAVRVLDCLVDVGIERVAEVGARRLWLRFRRRGARPHPAPPQPSPPSPTQSPTPTPGTDRIGLDPIDLDALADRVAQRVIPGIRRSLPQVAAEDLRVVVRLQLQTLTATAAPGVTTLDAPAVDVSAVDIPAVEVTREDRRAR